eukprot:TRINITY_DN18163_c0_g1_i1.p1 TRINITY_DN18163_c0_g1~~TRINITY_DN18163_c0_g1_i1.p1  ORF type:complete len:192 (-),score=47.48 TRINITY_DN18163_c0_g1_i1:42-539(-)
MKPAQLAAWARRAVPNLPPAAADAIASKGLDSAMARVMSSGQLAVLLGIADGELAAARALHEALAACGKGTEPRWSAGRVALACAYAVELLLCAALALFVLGVCFYGVGACSLVPVAILIGLACVVCYHLSGLVHFVAVLGFGCLTFVVMALTKGPMVRSRSHHR